MYMKYIFLVFNTHPTHTLLSTSNTISGGLVCVFVCVCVCVPGRGMVELERVFDDMTESCVVGVRKPDAKIFEIALQKAGMTPNQCVFLDDIGTASLLLFCVYTDSSNASIMLLYLGSPTP